jgi:putative N6-adenine-specific DNA methylase
VVTNPPYGVRVGDRGDMRSLYARTGAVLRRGFAGWRLAVVDADRALTGQLGITLRDVVHTSNGGLPVRFAAGDIVDERAGAAPARRGE